MVCVYISILLLDSSDIVSYELVSSEGDLTTPIIRREESSVPVAKDRHPTFLERSILLFSLLLLLLLCSKKD